MTVLAMERETGTPVLESQWSGQHRPRVFPTVADAKWYVQSRYGQQAIEAYDYVPYEEWLKGQEGANGGETTGPKP